MRMMGWYGDGMGWGGWVAMTLAMVLFWGTVIGVVLLLFRGTQSSGWSGRATRQDPMDILDERFARGEIDAEEYRARRAVLRDAGR